MCVTLSLSPQSWNHDAWRLFTVFRSFQVFLTPLFTALKDTLKKSLNKIICLLTVEQLLKCCCYMSVEMVVSRFQNFLPSHQIISKTYKFSPPTGGFFLVPAEGWRALRAQRWFWRTNGQMDGRTDGRTDRQTDGRTTGLRELDRIYFGINNTNLYKKCFDN